MEVILQEKIGRLGNLGDLVKVKPGYGRNYLIPYGKAVPATPSNKAKFEARRAELERIAAEYLAQAQGRADKLSQLTITIAVKAGDEGKLYGSLGTKDLADAISAQDVEVKKSEIRLPNGVIRAIGEYDIMLQLHSEVDVTVKVNVVAEG